MTYELFTKKVKSKVKFHLKRAFSHIFVGEELLFLFSGRAGQWQNMGAELYANELVFRQSIQESNQIILSFGGTSILGNFEGTEKADFLESEDNIQLIIASIQIALTDFYKSKGIVPHAVLGFSIGEFTSAYAAGALSVKEVLMIIFEGLRNFKNNIKKEYVVFYLQTGFAHTKIILMDCPVHLSLLAEVEESTVLVFCNFKDQEAAEKYFSELGIGFYQPHHELSYPYHSDLLVPFKDLVTAYRDLLKPTPLQCDFYSGCLGRIIPRGTIIDNEHWFEVRLRPIMFFSILKQIEFAKFKSVLNIGPLVFMEDNFKQRLSTFSMTFKLLKSMEKYKSEMQVLRKTVSAIKKIRLKPVPVLTQTPFELFKAEFNPYDQAHSENPFTALTYLRERGSIHFLPKLNSWFLLGYEQIAYVLKNPDLFSTAIYQNLDSFLIGADPELHKQARSLLNPVFNQPALNSIASFTKAKVLAILSDVPENVPFNFVEIFSIPLIKSVTANFIGIDRSHEKELDTCVLYDEKGFAELLLFCTRHLKKHLDLNQDSNNATGHLISAINNRHLSLEGASSIMRLLCMGSITTTNSLMNTVVLNLLLHNDLAATIKDDDELINRFIDECIRLNPPESELRRVTTQDLTLGDQILPANSLVTLGLRAANRDPNIFENPDEINLNRTANKHLSFGGGIHYCVGMAMARTEIREVIKTIQNSPFDIQLQAEKSARFQQKGSLRGLIDLPLIIKTKPVQAFL